MQVPVLELQGVFSHSKGEDRLIENAVGFQGRVELKTFEITASVGEFKHDEQLVIWEDIWKQRKAEKEWTTESKDVVVV